MARPRQTLEASGDETRATLPEVGTEPIENVRPDDFDEVAEREKFMNEKVLIYLQPTAEKGRCRVFTPNVNGINQPIVRGVKTWIKRKYVEAMLRNRKTRYEQVTPNPLKPERKTMQAVTALDEPFEILKDSDKGFAWAKTIRAEA